jgi:superfamily II DNA or RNA helicase
VTDFLRRERLDEAAELVLRAARFRAPQAASFARVRDLVERYLPDDLPRLDQSDVNEAVRQMSFAVTKPYPDLTFALATGVGKRRLLGAIAAYLYRARQTRNIVVLAPRQAILRRLESEALDVSGSNYLLLDNRLAQAPNVCTADTLDAFEPDAARLNLFILSPQSLVGANRRIAAPRPYSPSGSLLDYLTGASDLVILTDEAHHIGDEDRAWRQAIDALLPKLAFAFTATARTDAAIMHRYSLGRCLQEGLYTKSVKVLTKKRDELLDDEQWDWVTLQYAMERLELKDEAHAAKLAADENWPAGRPVLLLTCRDQRHADEVGEFVRERFGLAEDEVHVTHSGRRPSEAELERLIELDAPGNTIRVVVQVEQLTEGWDVRRVYVMAPLRTMGTFQYALQNLGRGLRLPAGRRIDDPDLDQLDVVLFGRETAAEIIDKAKEELGEDDRIAQPIEVTDADDEPDERIIVRVRSTLTPRVTFDWTWQPLVRVPPDLDLDFEPDVPPQVAEEIVTEIALGAGDPSASGGGGAASYNIATLKRIVVSEVCRRLEFLNEITDGDAVETLVDRIVAKLDSGAQQAGNSLAIVYVSPTRLTAFLCGVLTARRRAVPIDFEAAGPERSLPVDGLPGWLPPDGAQAVDQAEVK